MKVKVSSVTIRIALQLSKYSILMDIGNNYFYFVVSAVFQK